MMKFGVCSVLLCVGCGGGGLGKPVAQFPSQSVLERIAEAPIAAPKDLPTLTVDRWQIETPVPPADAAYPSETTWDQRFVAAGATHGAVRLSPALRCAATETARFFTLHGLYPDAGLRRYLAMRCGATLDSVAVETSTSEVADTLPDAELETRLGAHVQAFVERQFPAGRTDVGFGFARKNGRAAFVVYSGAARGRLRASVPLVEGSSVTISGQLPMDATRAVALANQGSFGVKPCEPDFAVVAPNFRVTCPILETDEQTRIEVASRKGSQVLMHLDLQLLVRRNDAAGLVYESNTYGNGAESTTTTAFSEGLLAGLNGVRRQAGANPLTLETDQSRMTEQLAPYFFGSPEGDAERSNTVALGLLAGWKVGGTIRDGGIYGGMIAGSRNPSRWLSYALESSVGRWVLLDPNKSRVAIGSGQLSPSGAMAVVTTYAFFDPAKQPEEEDAVFAPLAKLRAARGLPAPRRVVRSQSMTVALRAIATNSKTSGAALHDALNFVAHEQQRGVSGWVVETNDLEYFPNAPALLAPGDLEVEVGVTHYKAPGGAWGQYAVLFVILGQSAQGIVARTVGGTSTL